MPRQYLNNYQRVKVTVESLNDDLSTDWRNYPCLLWDRVSTASYASVFNPESGRKERVHQIAFKLGKGGIPDGRIVCHHCDTPLCYRPVHLFAGTHAENAADKVAKGRNFVPDNSGSRHGMSKLTDNDVAEIHGLRGKGYSLTEIAVRFRVADNTISRIVSGARWPHLRPNNSPEPRRSERRRFVDQISGNMYDYLRTKITGLKMEDRANWREYPCIEWPGSTSDGYGIVRGDKGRTLRAHRVAFEETYGKMGDPGLVVCHHCDNRQCFRPVHLFAGTAADNYADMVSKGRQCVPDLSGEKSPHAKLGADDVEKIRILKLLGVSNGRAAKMFGVRQSCISRITTGKRWRSFKMDTQDSPQR